MKRTKTIVLAKVIEDKALPNGDVRYTFQTQRNIKGTAGEKFTIDGVEQREGDLGTLNDHQDARFWEGSFGRSVHDTDCKIHPSFTLGDTYLIFLNEPYHQKSFEKIERVSGDKKDKWLAWVEEQAK